MKLTVALITMACGLTAAAQPALPVPAVQVECDVFTLTPPNNGSGPLWSYGCTQVARLGEEVYISAMETGVDAPLLCNTRWRLLKLEGTSFQMIAEDDRYRQREPCPLAVLPPSRLFMYVNDSLEPPGTKYGKSQPFLRVFTFSEDAVQRREVMPLWAGTPRYTDHSYRGYAADPESERLLMLNIDADTGVEHACLLNATGDTLATGSITFPIRSCYPQVALKDASVQVLAVGDIVEPIEAWRQYKFEQTNQQWDYVFRRLFLASTPDLRTQPFAEPLEIDSVDATGGHITNQDLWIAPDGEAWILYTRREVQNALMRDKFFPDKSILDALHLVRVRDGVITQRTVLLPENADSSPSQAKFHASPDGSLYVVLHLSGKDGGNKIMRLLPEDPEHTLIPIPLKQPLYWFCLATIRAGNAPSNIIDMFGSAGGNIYGYAGVHLNTENVQDK